MEKEDGHVSVWRPTRLLGHAILGGLFGLVCAVLPFGIGLSRTNLRFSAVPKLQPGAEDPVRLGIKALIWGSVYSVGGVGALTFGVCWLLNVKNFHEFGEKMRTTVPPKVDKIRRTVPKIRRRDDGNNKEHVENVTPNR